MIDRCGAEVEVF